MEYRSIADMNAAILKRLHILPRDFDLVVGIPRSGMLPANLLALYLNKPFTDIESFMEGRVYKAGARAQFFREGGSKKVLVVDDSIASGSALLECKEKLAGMAGEYEIHYCVIYAAPGKEGMVDHYFETVPLPRMFQWNVLNHTGLEKACFDIDGVLCADPMPEQNDDGPKYLEFLRNAKPLFVPGSLIGAIVTSRLEKYRPETEEWLKRHNIRYKQLFMLDLPDMAARQKANGHGSFKAGVYSSMSYKLFVESEMRQAIDINRLTGKPVLCTENFQMVSDSTSVLYNLRTGRYFPFLHRSLLKARGVYRKLRASMKPSIA